MPPEEQSHDDCIHMRFHGGKTYFDEMNGRVWYSLWPKEGPRVFFGHIPTTDGPYFDHVVGLDGGCVFGGELRIFDSLSGCVHSASAREAYAVSEYAPSSQLTPTDQVRSAKSMSPGACCAAIRPMMESWPSTPTPTDAPLITPGTK